MKKYCGLTGYFIFNPDNTYKFTFTVGNACGASAPQIGYFTNSDANLRKGVTETINPIITVYPNPSSGEVMISYGLASQMPVSIAILNSQGQVVYTALSDELQDAGNYEQSIDLSHLPIGLYVYRLITDQVYNGKLVLTGSK